MKIKTPSRQTASRLPFRLRYMIAPGAILLLSIILTVFFYPQLPDEVAYRFQPDGSADGWLRRGTITLILLVPQFILTLLAGGIALGITRLLQHHPPDNRLNPEKIIALMGNMLALPQSILCFAMFSIFSYNSYRIYLMPLWAFGLMSTVVGTVILALLFKSAIRLTSQKE